MCKNSVMQAAVFICENVFRKCEIVKINKPLVLGAVIQYIFCIALSIVLLCTCTYLPLHAHQKKSLNMYIAAKITGFACLKKSGMLICPYHPRLVKYRSMCIALGHCIMRLELHARSALRNMHIDCRMLYRNRKFKCCHVHGG